MKIVHIGLPKTATTSLQRITFPQMQALGLIGDFNPPGLLAELKRINRGFFSDAALESAAAEAASLHNPLISLEGLVGVDPHEWPRYCERNLRIFGADATILITLRDPKSYLRSIYQQVVHQGNVIPPANFFLNKDEYERCKFLPGSGNLYAIDVDAFDYEALVSMYADKFAQVVVVTLEGIRKMDFIGMIHDITPETKEQLKRSFAMARRQNVAYSRLAMKLTFIRERFFNMLGAKSVGSEDIRMAQYLEVLRGSVRASKKSRLNERIYKRIRVFLEWRKFMQHFINKRLPYEKWELPDDIYLGKNLDKNTAFYQDCASMGGVRILQHRRPDADPA